MPHHYSSASGMPIYGGRSAIVLPAWLQGQPLNTWLQIAGTGGSGGAALQAYSGGGMISNSVWMSAASGGHAESSDNRVVTIDLSQDAPAWVQRTSTSGVRDGSPSATVASGAVYNSDGRPASRHVYHSGLWNAVKQRFMLFGARFLYNTVSTNQYPSVDGFDPVTNTWDAQGTYADAGTTGSPMFNGGAFVDQNGDVWCANGASKYTVATNTWSWPSMTSAPNAVRYPWAWDSKRNQAFGLCFGDGEGAGNGQVNAVMQKGTVQTQITLTGSGLSQFLADTPQYAGMDYDPNNDVFMFCAGYPLGRVYIIVPNATSTWTITYQDYPGLVDDPSYGSQTASAVHSAGVLSRFKYVPACRGFMSIPQNSSKVHFLRTA